MRWFGLLQCISDTAAVTLLLRFVFGYARKERHTAFRIALCAAVPMQAALLFLFRQRPDAAELLQETFGFVCAAVFPYTLLRHVRRRTFFLFALAYCATADYIVSILPLPYAQIVYILLDAAACLSAVPARRAKKPMPPGFLDQIPVWIFFAVFTADLSAYYGETLHRDASYYAGVSVALKVLSLVLIGGSGLLIVRRILTVQRAEKEAAAQLAVQLRHYEELVEKNRSVRAFRHDYANNLLSLGAILEAGQTADAQAYVRQLQDDVQSTAYTYTTGNYLADAILSDKAASARQKEIRIAFSGTVPEKGIGNPDVCTILCNLLDNALRGSEGCACASCAVELTGRETADRWRLTVRNPVARKVDIRGGVILTTKTDKENHGIGIANVRRAAEKYHGYLELQCDDRFFTAEVGLMLKTEGIG